jgi:hypothetical protein
MPSFEPRCYFDVQFFRGVGAEWFDSLDVRLVAGHVSKGSNAGICSSHGLGSFGLHVHICNRDNCLLPKAACLLFVRQWPPAGQAAECAELSHSVMAARLAVIAQYVSDGPCFCEGWLLQGV